VLAAARALGALLPSPQRSARQAEWPALRAALASTLAAAARLDGQGSGAARLDSQQCLEVARACLGADHCSDEVRRCSIFCKRR
jgi:hypothetical protein